MQNVLSIAGIDWARYRLTRFRVYAICAALLAISLGVAAMQYSTARDNVLANGTTIGGDYVAFNVAAREAAAGHAAALYDPKAFEESLQRLGPPVKKFGLTFQYPPSYLFLILPLALFGFVPGFIVWAGAGAAAFFASLRAAGVRGLFLFVILTAPSTFHAVITGQNGFLTAALLIAAGYHADRRPILAGLAAALLTVKPQFGVLLPVAYLAAGCWRAFLTAAAGAVLLAGASVLTFGLTSWAAFISAFHLASDNLAGGRFPLFKMATAFAAARMAGLPVAAAYALQIAFAFAAALLVGLVWRRVKDADLRAAVLCAAAFLATPYGYYYEFVILAFPLAVVARRALEEGWLQYEQWIVAALFIAPLWLPGETRHYGLSYAFLIVLAVLACVLRRLRPKLETDS